MVRTVSGRPGHASVTPAGRSRTHGPAGPGPGQRAVVFIRRHRAHIRELVARWTGENQLTLDAVLDDMIARCREQDLRAVGSERKLLIDFTVLLTAKTMHALFGPSRRKWIAL